MLLLNLSILSGFLNVKFSGKELSIWPVLLQFATTSMSVFVTCFTLYLESKGLDEYLIEFIMTSVKAKQDWVPFGNKIRYAQMEKDIDYSIIEFKVPFLTDLLGVYKNFEYQFNEHCLRKLAT